MPTNINYMQLSSAAVFRLSHEHQCPQTQYPLNALNHAIGISTVRTLHISPWSLHWNEHALTCCVVIDGHICSMPFASICHSYIALSKMSKKLLFLCIFSCDQAALRMVFSVCLSVRLSVCPSHLFDYVPIIASSWNFQELSPRTRVTSMQTVKVRGQRSRSQRSRPKFSFPDCNSSLNSHMMMKCYI